MTTQQLADYLRIHKNRVLFIAREQGIPFVYKEKQSSTRGGLSCYKYFDPEDVVSYLERLNPGQVISISEKYL